MKRWMSVANLVVCVAVMLAVMGFLTRDASSADQGADKVSVKIGPSLAILLNMERSNFPVPPDGRVGQAIAAMRKAGGIGVILQSDHEFSASEMNTVEAIGAAFPARGTSTFVSSENVEASIPLGKVRDVAALSFVTQVDLWWTPWTEYTLDNGVPEAQGDLAWRVKDGQGQELTGYGTKIALFDTGIDLRHPDFWFADGQLYNWKDANPNDGEFVPGTDYLDLNGNQQRDFGEALRYLEAPGSENNTAGVFDTDTEWLYIDANENQIRDTSLTETVATYGEQIYVINDANKNRRLDPGESIRALHSSKVYKTYMKPDDSSPPVEKTRGINLVDTLSIWPDANGHGTKSSGVVAGGTIGRRYVGVAPGADLLVARTDHLGPGDYIGWAENQGAKVMLYEFGGWIGQYMDGSPVLEKEIDKSADRGYIQVAAAGNLADGQKHFRTDISAGGYQNVGFNVPQQPPPPDPNKDVKMVDLTVLWRTTSVDLQFEITTPTGGQGNTDVPLPGNGQPVTTADGHTILANRLPEPGQGGPGGTAMFSINIVKPTDQALVTGPWNLKITNPGGQPFEVNGYIDDDQYSWAGGTVFTTFVDTSKTVTWPGTAGSAVTVAAYMRAVQGPPDGSSIRPYSGRGPRIDGTAVLDIAAPSDYTLTTDSAYRSQGNAMGYHEHAGTSAAAPFVAGAVALMLQKDASLNNNTVKAKIQNSALKDTYTGSNPDVNVWGYGKLDVVSALPPGPPGIRGTVTLHGSARPPQGRIVPLTVRLYPPNSPNADLRDPNKALATYNVTSVDRDNSRIVRFGTPSQAGNYDLTIDSPHTLLNAWKNVNIANPSLFAVMGVLLEGDSNDDHQVNAIDFSILATSYLKDSGMPGFDSRADFDRNGAVTALDFSMLANNYLKTSPQFVTGLGAGQGGEGLLTLGTADLTLQPATQTVSVDDTFNVTIQASAGSQQVGGIDNFIDFDPAYLEVVSITNGTALPIVNYNQYDNDTGTLDFSNGKTGTSAPIGTFTVATIQFRAKAQTAGTSLTFAQTGLRNTDAAYNGDSVLGSVTGATVVIQP